MYHMIYGQSRTTTSYPSAAKRSAGFHAYYRGRRKTASSTEVSALSNCPCVAHSISSKLAPKPIARHIVLSAQDVLPTPNPSVPTASDSAQIYQNPPRQSYPKELLKHRFMPYGSLVGNNDVNAAQDKDVDMDGDAEGKGSQPKLGASPGKKTNESKGKKRKVEGDPKMEGDSPKKAKKAKIVV
jgi:DNA-directed RNA polymerase I subunit RPA34.5